MTHLSIEPNDRITFRVRYEDAHLAVVVKPPGIVTAPGKSHDRTSLLNGLFARYGTAMQNLGRERDFGLLHRLDKATSGLVMAALSIPAYESMRAAFEARRVAKFYWAVVRDPPNKPSGVINRPIAEYEGTVKGESRVKKLAKVSSAGKPALTAYRVVAQSNSGAILECRAVTGRLHQVRVHLDSIGCPILGDDMYGPTAVRKAAVRLALHAHRIKFDHPVTGVGLDVRAPWPTDLRSLLKRLGLERPDGMGDGNKLPASHDE
ncbi:MAG: RluA family pseudouridine synthase [Phycisphaerae bacterium]|nr:RluA family pseudouridine synthase [Phycisphaerae bacterium]